MDKSKLRQLINTEQWEKIGEIFDFRPSYCFINGRKYFDWVSAPAALMQMLHPHQSGTPVLPKKIPIPTTSPLLPKLGDRTFFAQKGLCFYCGRETAREKWTLDHKHPRSRGGQGGANKVGCCATCNRAKGNMTFNEFLETDYLPNDRRQILGFSKLPTRKLSEKQRGPERNWVGDIPSWFRNGAS